MRLTLEQLKAMSDAELYEQWEGGAFPFEMITGCAGGCLTMHADGCNEHKDLALEVVRLGFSNGPWRNVNDAGAAGAVLRESLEELYALRVFHDSLYPQPTPQPEQAVAESVANPEVVAK